MDIFTNIRIQYVEDGKRKALTAEQCHLDVTDAVAAEAIERGHAREATTGEIAEAEERVGRAKPVKLKVAKAAKAEKDDAAEKAAAEQAAADAAAKKDADLA